MTEEEAQNWLREVLGVSRETLDKLHAFRRMVIEENGQQNLISTATVDQLWARHIVDSAQLLALEPDFASRGGAEARGDVDERPSAPRCPRENQNWLDLGTGAGFPGMVIAVLRDSPITFVESRRKRIDFLADSVQKLALPHVTLFGGKLEAMPFAPFSVITARAFAPLPRLLHLAHSFSTEETLWLLPKGRRAREELDEAKAGWDGMFHVKQSLTDAESSIIVATGVVKKAAKAPRAPKVQRVRRKKGQK